VRNNAGDDVQITGNTCTELGEVALYAEFGFQGCVVANNIVDRASMGISITNYNEDGRLATVTGNVLRNLFRRTHPFSGKPDHGIGIGAEADTAVTGNVVEGAAFAGIVLGYGPFLRDLLCASNVVRRCGIGIGVSVVPNAGSAHVTNNVVSGCPGGALVGLERERIAIADLARPGRAIDHVVSGNLIR
jgi:uncharacterized secreted repeat protein (TIGR03808 family)